MKTLFLVCLAVIPFFHIKCAKVKKISLQEQMPSFWLDKGNKHLLNKLKQTPITSKAKNIILAIGDGMGLSTVNAARIVNNQRQVNSTLPDENLTFEDFPNVGLSQTYSMDRYVADSSATASAILTGTKVNCGVLGLSSKVLYKNCSSYQKEHELTTIAKMFYDQGKSVGFVTTSSIVGATPAALYASTPSRSWTHRVAKKCSVKDIASQFFDKAHQFNVVMGGGRKYFLPKTKNDPEYLNRKGLRQDGQDLIEKWKSKMKSKNNAQFLWNRTQFRNIDLKTTDYVLGLFEYGNLKYIDENQEDPTLEEMTKVAIDILKKNPRGYFLMIEGAKIDKAHHNNLAIRAILETLELEKAVSVAANMTSINDTLLIVTADHSHTLTIGSYVLRETDLMGLNKGYQDIITDRKGHTSLLYSNGPGYKFPRENITSETNFNPFTVFNSGVPLVQETHAGEDVPVYSRGPWSHLLKDLYEQSYIGTVMMYASCSDRYQHREGCNSSKYLSQTPLLILTVLNFLFSCQM